MTPGAPDGDDAPEAPAFGESFARRALHWDAAYSVAVGLAIAAFASSIEQHLDVSAWVVATTGTGAVAWAGVLAWLARRPEWRQSAGIAAVVNGVFALAVTRWAVSLGGSSGVILGLLALQVAGFAVAQGASAR
ncbi:MAG TPA: hypothetical protein VK960_06525 [Acidimicrobiia bacterium]|nr:hypothetical protein [Acidimicrobiia bacterium]